MRSQRFGQHDDRTMDDAPDYATGQRGGRLGGRFEPYRGAAPRRGGGEGGGGAALFVAQLSFSTTWSTLKDHFKQA